MLWLSGLLTLTRKSKFSKRTCPTRFFEYIPILGPVSSFEAQKLCKRLISKKIDFCANADQMLKFLRWTYLAQFFEYIPILESVSSFEIRKLHKWLKFQDNWLSCWNQPKVKIFKPHLPYSIFRVHSKFGVYFFIWESKIAQMVWFYNYWLWSELWPRIKTFEQSLSYSDFHKDSDFEIHLFVLDLVITNQTHIFEVLTVSKT